MAQSSRPSLASIASAYVSVEPNVPCERAMRARTWHARFRHAHSFRSDEVDNVGGVEAASPESEKRALVRILSRVRNTSSCQRPRRIYRCSTARRIEQRGARSVNFNRADESSRKGRGRKAGGTPLWSGWLKRISHAVGWIFASFFRL